MWIQIYIYLGNVHSKFIEWWHFEIGHQKHMQFIWVWGKSLELVFAFGNTLSIWCSSYDMKTLLYWLKRSGFEKNMQQLKQNPSHHFSPHPLHHHQHHPHFPPSTQSSLEYDNIPPLTRKIQNSTIWLKFKTNFKIVRIDQLNWCQFVTCSILIHPNSPKKYLFSTQSHFVFYRSLQTKSVHSRNLETSAAYFSEGHISTSLSRIKREQVISSSTSSPPDRDDELSGASPPSPESSTSPISPPNYPPESPTLTSSSSISGPGPGKGKRGRPRKHAPKLPLPPLYVFIRNMLHNPGYNPSVIAWVDDEAGCFKVSQVVNLLQVNFPPQQTELLWNRL